LATGLHSLDDRTGGLQRGEFIVLAGRPGMGKSALAVTIARLMAGAGFNVLLNSLEMTKEAVADRALGSKLNQTVEVKPQIRFKLCRGA